MVRLKPDTTYAGKEAEQVEILRPANLCLVALVLFFSLNLAPMMFESFTSDRIWASNPPESFYMFLGTDREQPTTGGSYHRLHS